MHPLQFPKSHFGRRAHALKVHLRLLPLLVGWLVMGHQELLAQTVDHTITPAAQLYPGCKNGELCLRYYHIEETAQTWNVDLLLQSNDTVSKKAEIELLGIPAGFTVTEIITVNRAHGFRIQGTISVPPAGNNDFNLEHCFRFNVLNRRNTLGDGTLDYIRGFLSYTVKDLTGATIVSLDQDDLALQKSLVLGTGSGSVTTVTQLIQNQVVLNPLDPSGIDPNSAGRHATINGTLEIDVPFRLGFNLHMTPGSKVVVNAGVPFQTNIRTSISACTELWDKIELKTNSSMIHGTLSVIRDAQTGVYAGSNTQLYLTRDSRILNCVTGVEGRGAGIIFSSFSGIGTVGPMVSGTAQRMHTGIKANACRNLTLSSTRFENIQSHGIYAENSTLSTKYCLFNKIGSTGVGFLGSPTPSTRAFWTSNSDSMNDMRIGANVLYAYHKMDTAKINNVDIGILYRSINARTVNHEVCTIKARKIDMEVRNSNPLSFEVRYGTYSTENSSNFDINERGNILLSNVGPPVVKANQMPNASTVRFHHNTLNVKNAVFGVRSTNSNSVELYKNDIELQTHGATGVELINNAYNNLQCNNIQGKLGEELTALTGVNAINASFNRYTCNNTLRTLTGMRFEGMCGDTKLRGNYMGRGTYGLKIDAPAALAAASAIGQQYEPGASSSYRFFGNKWALNTSDTTNTNGLYGAWHYSNVNSILSSSLFEIRKVDSLYDPIKNRQGWFVERGSGNTFSCSTGPGSSVCSAPGFGGFTGGGGGSSAKPNDDDLNQKLIQNGLGITHVGVRTGTTWLGRRTLLSSIWANQGQGNGSLQAGFYQNQQQTDLGQLIAAEDLLYQPNAIEADQSALLLQQLAQGQQQRLVLEEALMESKDAGDSATVLSQLQPLISQLNAQWATMEQSTATHQQLLLSSAQAAWAATSAVTTQSLPAQNLKTANTVHFNLLREGRYELYPQEIISLEPVAAQCPYTGGDGVYKARTLLNNHDPALYRYSPDHGCVALNQGLKESKTAVVQAWISPNPAWHTARVHWDPATLHPLRIRVIHTNGRILLEETPDANAGMHELDVSHLTNGQYLVQMLNQWSEPVQMSLVKINEE